MTRSAARVPGFASGPVSAPSGPATAAQTSAPVGGLSRRAGSRPLHLRLALSLDARYRRLLRDCEDDDIDTSMTEIVHALLHTGPSDVAQVRELLRAWRKALSEEL